MSRPRSLSTPTDTPRSPTDTLCLGQSESRRIYGHRTYGRGDGREITVKKRMRIATHRWVLARTGMCDVILTLIARGYQGSRW
jgi:hypothetical protein